MPAILKQNPVVGGGLPSGVTPYDSGNITAVHKSGVPARRLVDGTQQRSTVLQADGTAGIDGNFIDTRSPNNVIVANITNIAITSNVATITATNAFKAGMSVFFDRLTTVPAMNGRVGVVSATGLSTSAFQVAFTNPNVGSAAENGTATLTYQGRAAGLSLLQ